MFFVLISLFLLVSYIAYAIRSCGWVWSLSDTYYCLERKGKPKWLFQIVMASQVFLLLPTWLECSRPDIQFLVFLSCAGLLFVGSAPSFRLELEGEVHYAATGICGVSSLMWVILSGYWYMAIPMLLLAVYLGYRYKKWLLWIELAAFACTYAALILKISGYGG